MDYEEQLISEINHIIVEFEDGNILIEEAIEGIDQVCRKAKRDF